MSPLFSIVIPTRNRADTLRYTLQTCLEQDYDDYEIVVCDNSDNDATAELISEIAHVRIKYVKPPEALAMSANWELGVSSANGRYVTVLGDDDGLCSYALREAAALIAHFGDVDALRWGRCIYTWPSLRVARWANRLWGINLVKSVERVDMHERLKRAAKIEIMPDSLPMIYCSFVNRRMLEQLRELTGQVFGHRIPDIYSAYAIGFLARDCLDLAVPLSVAGISHNSNGMAQLYDPDAKEIVEDFTNLNARAGLAFHPAVPQEDTVWTPIHDAYLSARDRLFRNDPQFDLDLRAILLQHRNSIPLKPEERRHRLIEAVRVSIAHDAELLAWFDALPAKGDVDWAELTPTSFGLHGTSLSLDTSRIGVANILDVVRLVGALVGDDGKPFHYPATTVLEPIVTEPTAVVEPPVTPIAPPPPALRRSWLQRLWVSR
ncbi:MAG TPA: glycosyltransferase family A protein [Beijerinckiaceae bacterium]|jgi:glycosyltransferase involved in cell wall biosynthesis|nr:glycosyltransferase family A protein [Beijerinckiaceae bacterium]